MHDRPIKNLSVNNNYFPPADDCRSKTDKGLVAINQLLVSNKQLSEAVEPRVRSLDDPASVLGRTAAFALLLANPWDVAPRPDLLLCRLSTVSFIRI